MPRRYLVDANLPRYFSLWQKLNCEYVPDSQWSDSQIWAYARERSLTIITKDADFADRALAQRAAPPWVIHLKIGNLLARPFFSVIHARWPAIAAYCEDDRNVLVISNRHEVWVEVATGEPPTP